MAGESLGGAGFPAIFLGLGSLLIVETPISLIERGKTEEGIKALKTTRGVEDVQKVFQQFTGINVIMFYAPVLFQTMGLGADASLLSAVVTGSINSVSTLVAVFGVDKFGRRKLLIQAAVQMLISQAFLTMLCRMRSGIFFFFAAWIVVMGSFAVFLLPETKGVPIDEMNEQVWKKHWFWHRFFKPEDEQQAKC
ncbi:UNVERIFIED_CONTAM: Sugar transport protein 6 [Sesamum angustifolium]|uniref:Sugar transport protein 6 n=1 Tax=Sesamum angustifolium TaxID=2727405 RepID=A0AAW2QTC5_9LAMI